MTNSTENPKRKTVRMYAIWTSDDELHGSIKAYCATEELAFKEVKYHEGFYGTVPEIMPIDVIIEIKE